MECGFSGIPRLDGRSRAGLGLCFLILVVAGQGIGFCQAPGADSDLDALYTTHRLHNGRYWHLLSENSKEEYKIAFEDGLIIGAAAAGSDTNKVLGAINRYWTPENATDGFYSDETNLAIAIPYAFKIVRMKFEGAQQSDTDKEIARHKKN